MVKELFDEKIKDSYLEQLLIKLFFKPNFNPKSSEIRKIKQTINESLEKLWILERIYQH